jgi:hypothetical protein
VHEEDKEEVASAAVQALRSGVRARPPDGGEAEVLRAARVPEGAAAPHGPRLAAA